MGQSLGVGCVCESWGGQKIITHRTSGSDRWRVRISILVPSLTRMGGKFFLFVFSIS